MPRGAFVRPPRRPIEEVGKQQRYAWRFPDRFEARMHVNEAIKAGTLANPKDLLCVDCLTPAREYDHFKGYAKEHWFDVQPVCRNCHVEREKRRRPNCKRGHKYTEADWREVNGRKVRHCRECDKLRLKPGFEPVDGRGPKRGLTAHRGENHGAAKLTEDQVRAIRGWQGIATRRAIAEKYGISKTNVDSILAGRTWRHLI